MAPSTKTRAPAAIHAKAIVRGLQNFTVSRRRSYLARQECESCDDCDNIFDLTVDWEYEVTCEPGTSIHVYMDEDLDGVVDEEFWFSGCWYEEECGQEWEDDDCEDWEDNCELSDDLSSSPSGTTNHGGGNGWCVGSNDIGGCAPSPGHCWELCKCRYGDELVAIDWEADTGDCWCKTTASAWTT